jgi:hypothetical protein
LFQFVVQKYYLQNILASLSNFTDDFTNSQIQSDND